MGSRPLRETPGRGSCLPKLLRLRAHLRNALGWRAGRINPTRSMATSVAPERVVETLVLAWRKHAGGHNTLDDLCALYGVDRSRRTRHGALIDAELSAEVYVELTTMRQAALRLEPITLAPIRCRPQAGRCRSRARKTRPSGASEGWVTCTFAGHPTGQPRSSRG